MSDAHVTTIGLSSGAHDKLKRFKEDKIFGDMADGYRFAIGLALAHGQIAESIKSRQTIFNVGTLDPDRHIAFAIKTILSCSDGEVYRLAERLAEWGILEMNREYELGKLSITRILAEAERLTEVEHDR